MADLGIETLDLGAGLIAGLILGIERGWQLRVEPDGTRVAGVRTFTLLGAGGAIAGLLGIIFDPLAAIALTAGLIVTLLIGHWRDQQRKDATSTVAAVLAVGLGLLAGVGQPALALAMAAVVTFVLSIRAQSHSFLTRLNATDIQAFARYAVIAAAVLPFLPDRWLGPYGAWNPFRLWVVVVLVTGFSFLGYVANRAVGEKKGVLVTALIGGAYSSTAVTASLAERLGHGENGPLTSGILIASGVMYVRVTLLVAILSPSTFLRFLLLVGPAAVVGLALATYSWVRASRAPTKTAIITRNPVALLPAVGFVAIVAVGAVGTRWAAQTFGQTAVAGSLFLTGTFDVDAAIITLSGLPLRTIDRDLAALAIAGTVIANMCLKGIVTGVYARRRSLPALGGLAASTLVLAASVAVGWISRS